MNMTVAGHKLVKNIQSREWQNPVSHSGSKQGKNIMSLEKLSTSCRVTSFHQIVACMTDNLFSGVYVFRVILMLKHICYS